MSDTKNGTREVVEVSPEWLKNRDALAAKYRNMVKRHAAQEVAIVPDLSRLTFAGFESGAVHSGRKVPDGAESQGDYAKRFGKSSSTVTRWRRLGRALSLGHPDSGPEFTALATVINDGRVGPVVDDAKSLDAVTAARDSAVEIRPDGTVKRIADPSKAQAPASEDAPELVRLSAANVLQVTGALSSGIVRDWESWNLSAETAGALHEALTALADFVGEQRPKRATARSKRTA